MSRFILLAVFAGMGVPYAAFANSTVWVQIDRGNEAFVPVRNTNFDITTGWAGEQFTDENGDSQNDTGKYTWNTDDLPTDITVDYLLTSTFDVLSISATQISSGNLVERNVDSASITFTLDNSSDTLVVVELAPVDRPISCLLAPDANTRTGSPVLWGQAYHTAHRSIINPKETGYPVDLFAGDVTEKVVDLHVRGRGLDFVWSRSYHSNGAEDSEIGNDWDHSYNISVEVNIGNTRAKVRMGNGRTIVFVAAFRGGSGPINFWADGWMARLQEDPSDGVSLQWGDGTVWEFEDAGATKGKLDTITDRYGNVIDLTYDGNGRLTTITDTLGRDYSLAYGADGFLDTLTEDDGLSRVITYDHYITSDTDGNAGDLESVNYPAITGTVTGNNFASGRDLIYTYEETSTFSQETGDLLTIEDGRGNVLLTSTYDSSSRVTSQEWGSDGSTDAVVTFDYPSSPTGLDTGETKKTIVNDGEGNVAELFFNDDNQLLRTLEYTGRAVANVATTQSANRPANKLRAADPATYETTFTWDDNDLLTERVNPSGNRTVITYDNESGRRKHANNQTI